MSLILLQDNVLVAEVLVQVYLLLLILPLVEASRHGFFLVLDPIPGFLYVALQPLVAVLMPAEWPRRVYSSRDPFFLFLPWLFLNNLNILVVS